MSPSYLWVHLHVPFLDVGAGIQELADDIHAAVQGVLDRGSFILGDEVAAFESEFADYVGARHCVGVASGLDALEVALEALEIGPGDEVIVPGHTFVATWLAVTNVGATPVPVDVDADTFNLTPESVESAITGRTKAILPVHLYGQPAPIDELVRLARARGLLVVEDAAQCQGACYRGRRIGSHGDVVTWSFYPSKNLGAIGDGGAVTTDRDDVAERMRLLHNYGSRQRYVHETRGRNSRLDEIQAAVLRVKLRRLDDWNERRRAVARRYTAALTGGAIQTPQIGRDADPVWHLYVVRVPHRDEAQRRLSAAGVQTLIHYPTPPHLQPAYRDVMKGYSLPVTERISQQVLSLPIGPHLTAEQSEYVVEQVRSLV